MLARMHTDMTLGRAITTLGPVPWPILVQQQQLEAARALLLGSPLHHGGFTSMGSPAKQLTSRSMIYGSPRRGLV